VKFFVGLHQPCDAIHFDNAFISVNRLRPRRRGFVVRDWIMDSGAFTAIATHGGYPAGVDEYAEEIERWRKNGNLLAAVSQDFMCEPVMLKKTGLTVQEHQARTIDRYLQLAKLVNVYIMPVLQGYRAEEYAQHVLDYGRLLKDGAWVGVGSICKRNGDPSAIVEVLSAVKSVRSDLRLHGFGLKTTALKHALIRNALYSADSMAWSFSARKQGRNGNDWREARAFSEIVSQEPAQGALAIL
jgi:hypothetical protein